MSKVNPGANLVLGRTATRLARQVAKALDVLELSATQYQILVSLGDGISSISRVAQRVSVTPATISVIVDGLVQKGWVLRTQSKEDRRHVDLTLTATGRSALDKADVAVADQMLAIADELGSLARREQAIEGLQLWHEALDCRVARRHGLPLPSPVDGQG